MHPKEAFRKTTYDLRKDNNINVKKKIYFFFINNVRRLLIIERLPNQVHQGCTMEAQIRKQKNNGQEKKKMKNKKNEKKPHSIQRECVRKKT